MQTWADENTAWPKILGFQVPSTWFQSFNSFFIFILAPPLDMLWAWQARRSREPSSVAKMAIGSIILGLSFIIMVIGADVVGDDKGSLFWPVFCTLAGNRRRTLLVTDWPLAGFQSIACANLSLMMGMWFISSFFGNVLSGYIGKLYENKTLSKTWVLLAVDWTRRRHRPGNLGFCQPAQEGHGALRRRLSRFARLPVHRAQFFAQLASAAPAGENQAVSRLQNCPPRNRHALCPSIFNSATLRLPCISRPCRRLAAMARAATGRHLPRKGPARQMAGKRPQGNLARAAWKGFSAVSVVGDRPIRATAASEGEFVLCLNPADGKRSGKPGLMIS